MTSNRSTVITQMRDGILCVFSCAREQEFSEGPLGRGFMTTAKSQYDDAWVRANWERPLIQASIGCHENSVFLPSIFHQDGIILPFEVQFWNVHAV